jgi:hypothetical protein
MLDKHEKRRRAVIKALRPLHHDDDLQKERAERVLHPHHLKPDRLFQFDV